MAMCEHGAVSEEEAMSELRAAAASYRRIKTREAAAYERLVEAMRAASAAGVRQVKLVELTGYTREHVRRLLKA